MTALRPEQPIVLVPIGHTAGQPQLQAAEEYARALHGDVLLVHVLAPRDAHREAAAQAYLDTLVEYLASRCIQARAFVRTGNLARTVVAEAQSTRAAAIVLGVSRPPALLSGLIGGVSTAIARAADCPVVLVQRPRGADPEPAVWDFGDAVKRAGPLWRRPARSTTVDVARIVGSVDRSSELGADFRPHRGARRKLDDQRLDRIRRAIERGRAVPAVDLYQIGSGYYVLDGHHRVAAALLLGQTDIDANVVEYAPRPAGCAGLVETYPSRRVRRRSSALA
jgi:nucleotide-binding universal stress UspA family protein